MRIIVTRPYHSGRRTAERLQRLGHLPVILPLTAPSHDLLAAERALAKPYGALAITSAEAVRALVKLGPQLLPHLSAPLFTVGRVTEAVARNAGFTAATSSDGGGRELADLVAGRFAHSPQAEPLLYLAGRPRTATFERALAGHGIEVRTAECYHMLPLDHEPDHLRHLLIESPVDVILFYSRENVDRFFSLPVFIDDLDRLKYTRFLCLSRNIAAGIPQQFEDHVSTAAIPDEDALLSLL